MVQTCNSRAQEVEVGGSDVQGYLIGTRKGWVRGRGGRKEVQDSKTVLSTVGRKCLKIGEMQNSDEHIKLTAERRGGRVLGFMFTKPLCVPRGPIGTD